VSRLQVRNLGKVFGATRALAGVDLDVGPGEILGVTGPSGAGKSTLCRVVAGVEAPSTGEVLVAGTPATRLGAEERRIACMFESYALYPHLSVFDNVAFPLRAPGRRRLAAEDLAARVREVLRLVELQGFEARRPAELSGGQRQRVALCRALVQEPRAWLLDEPLSHLDAKLRHVLRGALRRRLGGSSAPAIWTSPDALEALAVADRVAVLVEGRILQCAPPAEVFRRPATLDVARLVGDPPMNLLKGVLTEERGTLCFRHAAFTALLGPAVRARLQREPPPDGVVLGLRPTDIGVVAGGAPSRAGREARGEVWVWEPLGKQGILSVRLGPDIVKVKVARAWSFRPGEPITLDMTATEPALFDAATGAAMW
jgi:multiple sugar transport system ATP-binding protein